MMGTKIRSFSPLPHDLSLEDLVPKDNFYRRLEGRLDLSFVRELVAPLYAKGGRPSVDPVVFFKLQLVLFCEDLRSERQLMGVVADRLSVRWYLGYDLHEPLPDHSTLTRVRERYGLEVFRLFFERIVEMCVEAGLVWGEELFFDSTAVKADASNESVVPRLAVVEDVEDHLGELFEDPPEDTDTRPDVEHEDTPPSPDAVLPTSGDGALRTSNRDRRDWISKNGRPDRSVRRGGYLRMSDGLVSRTDPDATHTGRARTTSRLGYNAHYVVDGGKARIILSALVVPADVKDNLPMLDLLWRTCFRWRLRPHHVTGDSIYGSLQNIRTVEDGGIRAFVPVRDWTHNFPGSFSKKDFRYDERRNLYICPEGEDLRHIGNSYTERVSKYRADAATCNSCALKAKCTRADSGRLLRRSFDEHYIERVRAYHETEACKKAMRKRQVWIEPLFGEAKQWHGMERMRLRTLERTNCEVLITASGQNVKRLLKFGGREPRRPAQVAALRPPTRPPLRLDHHRHPPALRAVCPPPWRFSTRCGVLRSSPSSTLESLVHLGY
jgi:transposase